MSFLNYTGIINFDDNTKNYCFQMEDKKEYLDKIYMNIPKPITDTNFKQVFGKNPEIAKSLINSFLFPKTKKIKSIEYLSGELPGKINAFPEPVNTIDFDLLRVDILCRCELEEENSGEDREEFNKYNSEEDRKDNNEGCSKIIDKRNFDNTYIIDLEMQIGFSNENTRQFLTYVKKLDLKYKDRIIVLSLVSKGLLKPKKDNSSFISLQEQSLFSYKSIYEFDDYVIYQIDLDYCRNEISSNNEDLWITEEKEKLNKETKEWLKYLTLSTWCKSFKKDYYALPTVKKEFFKNKYVYDAIAILCNQDDIYYQMDLYDHRLKKQRIKKFKEQEKENIKLKKEIEELKAQLNAKNKKKFLEPKRKTPLIKSNSYDRNSNSSNSKSNSSFNSKK